MTGIWGKLCSLFLRKHTNAPPRSTKDTNRGFLVFHHTGEVIRAEHLLRNAGFIVEVKGPPPELRTGCDMVLLFELVRQPKIMALLAKANLVPERAVPVSGTLLEPVALFQTRDFGQWFMVRAANMKITLDKANGTIVNISGGGCPDVPWLAMQLVGRRILDVEDPLTEGQTLCAYALQKAFEEARRLCHG
ncbi:MAG: DUF3343 domain-containing protein [Desulfovibrio sp.]|nr:DUF3343 domain-containing protein [Desulfovibrio sp.]